MTRPTIAVTGLGIASAVGWTPDETWSALREGRGGLRSLDLFPSERCGHLPVGELPGDPAARSGLARGSRSDHLAVWAARQAFADAALARGGVAPRRVALVLGALTGGMMYLDALLANVLREGVLRGANVEDIACCCSIDRVAEVLDAQGFRTTISNACASGGAAVSVAMDLLESGEADVVLAGGVDSLNRVVLNGFHALMLVSPDGCRPFDAERKGMTVGEGAGVLVLETLAHARARGARVHAIAGGCGCTCDAHHLTAPHPEGEGLLRAMRLALDGAGLAPADVDYVNAHGTGTKDNDLAEGRAIVRLFGERLPAVSSTKRFFGHTLAAAGAIEAIVSILAIVHRAAPPNLGLRTVDPAVGFVPVSAMEPRDIDVALSTSLGFGGNNSAVVFRRPDPRGEA